MSKYKVFVLLFLFFSQASAQEVLSPVFNNRAQPSDNQKIKKAAQGTEATLPFYDDFSVISNTPNTLKWADSYVLINADYGYAPPTIGVATLDALNQKGELYPTAGPYSFSADQLTSVPLRLDSIFTPAKRAIRKADSVYLSFFYQPQGRAISPPSKQDSLILEFHSPAEFDTVKTATTTTITPKWRYIWSATGGTTLEDFKGTRKQYFKQVLVPVTDSALYFKKGFQFRFRNTSSLKGQPESSFQVNGDVWNVDAVWLNTGRTKSDTLIKDVAFAGTAPSLLRNYQAMPFAQYRANFVNEMKDSLDIAISNLDKVAQNIAYQYTISKGNASPFASYNGGNYSIFPYLTAGYSTYKPFARPPVVSVFPISNEQNVSFSIKHSITSDPNPLYRSNDTISFTQIFNNYYAYDNGTAEAGIGLNNATPGSYAVKFQLNKIDTLQGMMIYFNQILSATSVFIDLKVWNDANGMPGKEVYALKGVSPQYSTTLNDLKSYWFEKPLLVDATKFPGLIFYIGWTQTSSGNLNVGFDRLNDSQNKRFFNVDGAWQQSSLPRNYGSLMMRPVIGNKGVLSVKPGSEIAGFNIYPNPCNSNQPLTIELPEKWRNQPPETILVKFYSIAGVKVLEQAYKQQIALNDLKPGFYIVALQNIRTGETATRKLVVQ